MLYYVKVIKKYYKLLRITDLHITLNLKILQIIYFLFNLLLIIENDKYYLS